MIARLVSFALSQRFLIVIGSLMLMIWGAVSFEKLPIDAYPDLSPPHVEIISQWPGHAAEEVERLVSIPIEIEMNGIPRLDSLRSISLYGLSSVQMNFDFGTNPYFVREQAFERVANATVPSGVTPTLSPLFSPSGLIYRYVLQSTDRTPQELKTIEDWVLERRYRAVQGVADDSGFGGTTMQYQVLLDPNKLFAYGITVPQVAAALGNNNSNAGGGLFPRAASFTTSGAWAWFATPPISATSWSRSTTEFPSIFAISPRCRLDMPSAWASSVSCTRTRPWKASS